MNSCRHRKLIVLARGAALLYAVFIFVFSLMPGSDVPLSGVSDKYRHTLAYAGFTVLIGLSFVDLRWRAVPLAFGVASLVGIAIEWLQPYFDRTRDVGDVLANATGAGIGCAMLVLIFRLAVTRDRRQGRLSDSAKSACARTL